MGNNELLANVFGKTKEGEQAYEIAQSINFCIKELGLANSKRGFSVTKLGLKAKSKDELVKLLIDTENLKKLKEMSSFFNAHYSQIRAQTSDALEVIETTKLWLDFVIAESLAAKRTKREMLHVEHLKNTEMSYINNAYEDIQEFRCNTNFNDVDESIFDFLYYCDKDGYFYAKVVELVNGEKIEKLKAIGTVDDVIKNEHLNGLDDLFKKHLKAYCQDHGIDIKVSKDKDAKDTSDYVFAIVKHIEEGANRLKMKVDNQLHALIEGSDLDNILHKKQEELSRNERILLNGWDITRFDENMHPIEKSNDADSLNDEAQTGNPQFMIVPREFGEDFSASDFIDNISKNAAVKAALFGLPATLVNLGYINAKFRYKIITVKDPDDEEKTMTMKSFDKIRIFPEKRQMLFTDSFWLTEVLSKATGALKALNPLLIIPRTYTDDPKMFALMHKNEETLKKWIIDNGCYQKLEDCKALSTLKSWMSEFEFKAVMAWCYSACNPTAAPSEMSLFLHTGGGTGKSTLYRILEYAMSALTGESPELFSQRLLGDAFDKEDFNIWNPMGEVGICKAALINIDEANSRSLEIFKNFSGTPGGNKITGRKIYSNATSEISYAKWMFTSNRPIELTSDDGSLKRRIAIIEHPEKNNCININGMTTTQLEQNLKKEVLMLLKLGKKCYDELTANGKSLDEVLMTNVELSENLRKSVGTEANEDIFEIIKHYIKEECDKSKGEYRIGVNLLKKFYTDACRLTGYESSYFTSFKKWLKKSKQYKQARTVQCLDENNDIVESTLSMKCFSFTDEDLKPMISAECSE